MFDPSAVEQEVEVEDPHNQNQRIGVTLVDANHCPGAVLMLFRLPHENKYHLHTGDLRFHPRMKSYPAFQNIHISSLSFLSRSSFIVSVLNPSLVDRSSSLMRFKDLYLDTTYCKEEYVFPPQDKAIQDMIKIIHYEVRRERKKE